MHAKDQQNREGFTSTKKNQIKKQKLLKIEYLRLTDQKKLNIYF